MRKFSSYGPIDPDLHYYAPRSELIEQVIQQLTGDDPQKGGHYITVWGPRQRGKTWIMQQALQRLRTDPQYERFDVIKLNLEHLKLQPDINVIVQFMAREIIDLLKLPPAPVETLDEFYQLFRKERLPKPLILILDEFDALNELAISGIASVFRNIYNQRQDELDKATHEKRYLLHGVALIGVRSVLGIENSTGSPFNVQRSLHIPNLTAAEVASMFHWYEQESGQRVDAQVIERLYTEVQGQPGLTSWLGELLTKTYNKHNPLITMRDLEIVYAAAVDALPNANIVNLISKARQDAYRPLVLALFQTDEKVPFRFDDPQINFLYMNGVIDEEVVDETRRYAKFPCPFVQKRLFHYFAHELVPNVGRPFQPFEDLSDTITPTGLNIKNLVQRYGRYLQENRRWLLHDAPRKSDLRYYEAIFHFSLYLYLVRFLQDYDGRVYPEFPTGNGQIDLIIEYAGHIYGLELKNYASQPAYQRALEQAARYGQQLQLNEITLVFFVDSINTATRTQYEAPYQDPNSGVQVLPIFVTTAS